MIVPPGSGKMLIARRLPTILPPLGLEEALEITMIYSIAGMLPEAAGWCATGFSVRRTTPSAAPGLWAAAASRGRARSAWHREVLLLEVIVAGWKCGQSLATGVGTHVQTRASEMPK